MMTVLLYVKMFKKTSGVGCSKTFRCKAFETGNRPKGGTERCPLREEILKREAYVEVRWTEEG
jgi:hypothetical protein